LRTIRKLYGYSQQKLATVVGCSLATVKFIETRRLKPSAELADRVRLATGLDPLQLIGNFSPDKPRDPTGQPLTKETIKLRQDAQRINDDQTRDQVDGILQLNATVEEALFDASVLKGKLWALRAAYKTAMSKLISDFDLAKDFRRILSARYGVRDPWSANGYKIEKSLQAIINTPLPQFEARRKAAQLNRDEFYGGMRKLPMGKNTDRSAA
jgi:transcriptional regulator with XRE-family HTH domain